MKNKLFLLFVLIATFGYAQTFDWETAYHGADTPNGPGYTNNRAIQEFTTPYNAVIFTTPNATPINISNVGQGTTGLSVLNAAYETSVEAYFAGDFLDIQSIKVFTRPNSSNENWTFKGKDAGGNVTNTLTAAVTNTASVITLNFTNVYVLEITKTDGTTGTFGVDDIVFTPYVAPIVTIPDANFKAYLVNNYSINTNYDSEIQVSEATAFTGLINCSNLSISDLTGIEAFVNITDLICSDNNLTSIDISAILNLGELDCSDNQLTSLNTSLNTGLYNLNCANNALTSIDLSSHPNINTLYCNGNNITTLNLSNLTSLYDLDCSDNQITSIDASNIPLQYFDCQNNALTSLNVANGNNYNIVDFFTTNNPNLTCIEVDDVVYSDANWTIIDAQTSFSTSCSPCTVNIPDANFKAYLVGNTLINTNGDTEIQCSEATAFTGAIDVYNLGITDLTGVEAFTALTELQCSYNQLTSLDLSANTALTELQCNNNQLTTLDISGNTALTNLRCRNNQLTSLNLPATTNALSDLRISNNQLTSLDVSANTALRLLECNFNQLTSLNVSANTALENLYLYDNPITSIDVSANTALIELELGINPITSLDVSANTALQGLYFSDTPITSIDVSNNTALKWVYIENSQLTSLDLSAQPNLIELTCSNTQLTSLNIANGNNANIDFLDATNNTALTCIEVDAAIVGTTPTGWYKDAGATYSASCTTCTVNIPDANFKTYLVGNTAINTNGDTEIQCSEASAFTGAIDVYNLGITDLTGVEAFTALTELQCSSNQLTSLDVSANTALTYLDCLNNQLTSLDVSANTALTYLDCSINQLTSLDVSSNTALTALSFMGNPITSIDVSANTALQYLYFNDTQLTSIDVSTNTAIEQFYAGNCQLTSLDLSAQPNLEELSCYSNSQLTSLNVANGNNGSMSHFDAANNTALTCIEVDAAIVGTTPTGWSKDATASYSDNCGALSVDEFSLNAVSMYPNPATSVLNIKMNQGLKQATIYSMLGKQVLKTQNNAINVSGLSNGVYVISIEAENGNISTKRFIKK